MFDPITIGVGALIWMAFKKQSASKELYGVLTPEREEIYRNAMEYCKEPERLQKLANDFDTFGLKAEAYWMRKRAEWRSRPEQVKAQHDAIFEKAMSSDKVAGILEVANIFQSLTATIKAGQLRERAKSLEAAAGKTNPSGAKTVVETKAEEVPPEESMSRHTPVTDPQGASVNEKSVIDVAPEVHIPPH